MAESSPQFDRWLSAARAGSRDDLGRALEAYRGYLLAVAGQELDPDLQSKEAPSDLVQQTFLEAQRDFGRFQGQTGEELMAWLRQLLLHNVADCTRRYRLTARRDTGRELPLDAGGSSAPTARSLPAEGSSPSAHAAAGEQADALRQALARLPEDYQQVLRRRYQEQRSFAEIAGVMDRTTKAVRMLWARAVQRLRHELGTPP
jgi:RNA polymerase sigma-70 factor (ECF subfamily)